MPNQYSMNSTTNNNANGTPIELAVLSTITPDIRSENDLTSLLGRLTSFDIPLDPMNISLDPMTSIIERQQSIKRDQLDLKNIDLTEMLLQEQNNHIDSQPKQQQQLLPNNSAGITSANIMNSVDLTNRRILRSFSKEKSSPNIQFSTASANIGRLNLADNKLYTTRQQKLLPTLNAILPGTSTNNNQLITNGKSITNGHASTNGNSSRSKRVEIKRLSSTSNSTTSSATTESREKRGRKPTGAPANPKTINKTEKLKQQAKAQLKVEEDKLARFGNKYVVKDTDEYEDRRKKNNEAVQKCRQKNAEEQKKREETMKKLTDDNNRLTAKVSELTKELSVLKSIVLKSTPLSGLPDNIQKLLHELETTNQK
jgi:hypothetical protein